MVISNEDTLPTLGGKPGQTKRFPNHGREIGSNGLFFRGRKCSQSLLADLQHNAGVSVGNLADLVLGRYAENLCDLGRG